MQYIFSIHETFFSALYTIITFPFLFAVMFGDSGHGIIMALFGLYMVIYEKPLSRKEDQQWDLEHLFLRSLHNLAYGHVFDVHRIRLQWHFSKSMNLFGTTWTIHYNKSTVLSNQELTLNPTTDFSQDPYFIGIDPVWQVCPTFCIIFDVLNAEECLTFLWFVWEKKYKKLPSFWIAYWEVPSMYRYILISVKFLILARQKQDYFLEFLQDETFHYLWCHTHDFWSLR